LAGVFVLVPAEVAVELVNGGDEGVRVSCRGCCAERVNFDSSGSPGAAVGERGV
jgi:hypothetical protein